MNARRPTSSDSRWEIAPPTRGQSSDVGLARTEMLQGVFNKHKTAAEITDGLRLLHDNGPVCPASKQRKSTKWKEAGVGEHTDDAGKAILNAVADGQLLPDIVDDILRPAFLEHYG